MSEADKIIESLKNSGKKVEEFYVSNKGSNKNVCSIEEDIRILQEKDCMWHYPETRIEEAIEDIIADYTRQKEMNEEHQKINEELRERVKELERGKPKMRMLNCAYSDRNEDSVYTTRFAVMQKQIDEKDKRIQELEEERDHWHGCFIVAMENSIAKEKVIDVIQEYKNKVEQYNKYREQGKETDVEYYENIANTIVVQVLQELLEGEKNEF